VDMLRKTLLDGVTLSLTHTHTHTHGPAASFFNCMGLIIAIKSHELIMKARALSKHLPLHTFVVVVLKENGYFTNNVVAAAVVVVVCKLPVTYS